MGVVVDVARMYVNRRGGGVGRPIVEKTYDCKDVCMMSTFSKW
jgi:hypothetical protein